MLNDSLDIVSIKTVIELHDNLNLYLQDMEKTIKSLRSGYGSNQEWRQKIDQDPRPAVKLLYREYTKAEANLKGLMGLTLELTPADMHFIRGLKESLEV